MHPSSATPTDATPTEATPSGADTPSSLGTLENAKILAKLRCYTCIYKKYTLEEWKKFDNENSSDIVKYLVVAIGSGKDYYCILRSSSSLEHFNFKIISGFLLKSVQDQCHKINLEHFKLETILGGFF